jgi:hypothetical protein
MIALLIIFDCDMMPCSEVSVSEILFCPLFVVLAWLLVYGLWFMSDLR